MNNIFILDGQTDEVLGHINKKYVIDNEHEKDLPSHKDYFQFTVLDDDKHAEHLTKRNGLIIPGEDGELLEFRIFESIKYRNSEGLFVEVHALATYLDLKTQKIFDPHKTEPETALQHATIALDGTEWQVGEVDVKGIRTLEFDNPFNSYDYILRIAREFELEPRFYIKTDGNKVTGRYVDLIERIGEFRGRTIEFGRDLQKIERKEDTSNVVTALWVYGPQREDGTRLKVFVEDDEARQRWGRRGQHIIDYYEPQTENQDITEERLRTLGEMELKKRINAVVTYEAEILDLENVPGLENKKIRFGDTIRIKDTKFNPPLYVEARVFNVKRDVFNKANKTVQLGDFVEYTEEEVQAIWKLLQQQIQQKISAVQAEQMIEEYAEPKKVESPTPPPIDSEGDNPIWVDTSQEPYVPHVADTENNEWVKMTLSDEDVLVNDVNYNGLKWSKDEGLIVERSDGKVRSILNGTDGIKVQQKIGSEWVDVYYVDENGNVKYAGELEGASGTFGKVTVKDGDFLFTDTNSNEEYSIIQKTNFIVDHSFEACEYDIYTWNTTYNWANYDMKFTSGAPTWVAQGSPKMTSFELSGYSIPDIAIFGNKSMVVNNSNYVYTDIRLPSNSRVTVSAYFSRHHTISAGKPRFIIQRVDGSGDVVSTISSKTFDTVPQDFSVYRYSLSFSTPSLGLGESIRIIITSGDVNWVKVDGVQANLGDLPTLYIEDSSLNDLISGRLLARWLRAQMLDVDGTSMFHGNIEVLNGNRLYLRRGSQSGYIFVNENNQINTGGLPTNIGHSLYSFGVYQNTTSTSANVAITSNYQLVRSSSSIKYKKNVEDLEYSLAEKVLQLRPVWYRDKETNIDARPDWSHVGLIAEEVHEIEPRLVQYKEIKRIIKDEKGNEIEEFIPHEELEPEGVNYDRIAVYLLPIIKKQQERITELEKNNQELKERLEKLEKLVNAE